MASPQVEDGFIKIANEFFEELIRAGIPQTAMQVFLAIIRFTWGYNRKEARIRLKDFSRITGMKKYHVSRELKRLKAANMVTQLGNFRTLTYGIQKDYDKWKRLPKRVTLPTGITKGYPEGQPKVTQMDNQKDGKVLPINGERQVKDISLNTISKNREDPFKEMEKLSEEEIQANRERLDALIKNIGGETKEEEGEEKGSDIPF